MTPGANAIRPFLDTVQMLGHDADFVTSRPHARTSLMNRGNMNVKQVIVMRTDLNMRKGKMIAQGAHASMAIFAEAFRHGNTELWLSAWEWLLGSFTKVCVRADSEDELMDIYRKAYQANLHVRSIVDSGLTEFHGVPTNTCLAIGPDESEKIDEITGHLKLL